MSQLFSPVLHTQDTVSALGEHLGITVTFPLKSEGCQGLVTSKGSHATEEQAISVCLHTALFPAGQGKEIHQNYPTPTPSGHPETSPLIKGETVRDETQLTESPLQISHRLKQLKNFPCN